MIIREVIFSRTMGCRKRRFLTAGEEGKDCTQLVLREEDSLERRLTPLRSLAKLVTSGETKSRGPPGICAVLVLSLPLNPNLRFSLLFLFV